MPKFSIITINYNNRDGLKQTLESVVNQTSKDFEYIVIDGGSTDGSIDVIKEYADRITYWVSEKDNGIYNAMNKGVAVAKGEYCNFMNSGDYFADPKVLEDVVAINISEDVVVGSDLVVGNIRYSPKRMTLERLCRSTISHQAAFIKTKLLELFPYDEKLKIVSDWKFWIQAFIIGNKSYRSIDRVIDICPLVGVSDISNPKYLEMHREERNSVLEELFPPLVLEYIKKIEDNNLRYFYGTGGLIARYIVKFLRGIDHIFLKDLMMTKIVKLQGGLGNQMFQYAFGKALEPETYFDLTWFDTVGNNGSTARKFELNLFNCKVKPASKMLVFVFLVLGKLFRLVKKQNLFVHLETHAMMFDSRFLHGGVGLYCGYFQCEKYFSSLRYELLKDFSLGAPLDEKNMEIMQQIKSCNSVSLHVRRGDYVKLSDVWALVGLDYYKRAISHVMANVSDPHFFIFSDDIEWVRDNLKISAPFTIVDINKGEKSIIDMMLMKACKHNIIANSSFSWWGAWLNENPDKIVIAPLQWFVTGSSKDMLPPTWMKM